MHLIEMGSFEHSKHLFKLMDEEKTVLCLKNFAFSEAMNFDLTSFIGWRRGFA